MKESAVLGPLRAADSPLLWDWINDRDLVTLNGPYRPVHAVTHDEWFARVQAQKDAVTFGIRLRPTDRLIGTCQLHTIHPVFRSAELQIRIGDPASRGKGHGTRVVRQLVHHGFTDLNLNRIHLHVLATNVPARRLYAKCQFREEGCCRSAAFVGGRYVDVILMGLLREEYAPPAGSP
jgi:RimJ/RimL family protein N-acetyltransferase